MKQALYYKKLKNKIVQCSVCPRNCIIKPNKFGFCKARKNQDGILYSFVYAAPCSVNIDPIEKKPLFHFLPGTKTYSIGTSGCNLRCKFCQNWQISQAMPDEVQFIDLPPEKIVEEAINNNCKAIAYTYTEPAVFYEYVLDTAKLARKKRLKNICVTNGFINQEPLKNLYKYIDAANVDLKGFTDHFYKNITGAWLNPVLETLKTIKKKKIWLEITNLIIPNLNDNLNIIKKMCEWIKKELGKDTPLHFSRFFPVYLMQDFPPTNENILLKAADIAKKAGLNYVYIGNIKTEKDEKTRCPKCSKIVIERDRFNITENKLKNGRCPCGKKIFGIWK